MKNPEDLIQISDRQSILLDLPGTHVFPGNQTGMAYLRMLAVAAIDSRSTAIQEEIEYFEDLRLTDYGDPNIDCLGAAFEAFDNHHRTDFDNWHLLEVIKIAEKILGQ